MDRFDRICGLHRIIRSARRPVPRKTLEEKRDTATERTVSPRRLVHYRDDRYLDAWRHSRRGLRSFSLDRIRRCRETGRVAAEIDDGRMDRHFAGACGIFSGVPGNTAVLSFSPERARWVAEERRHRDQRGRFL